MATDPRRNCNYKVAQLAQHWVEGAGTSSTSTCDGARWFNRNAGTVVDKTTFGDYGTGNYYIDGVADLGDDPANVGKKHVRPANTNANSYNAQNVCTQIEFDVKSIIEHWLVNRAAFAAPGSNPGHG